MPKISLIIPNYNKAQYLCSTFASVRAQTFTDWEAIVIDDGSTDDSARIIKKFISKDSRFRAIFQKNSGVCAARNAGLAAANGDYIMFLDSDDCLVHTAMQSLYDAVLLHGAELAGGRMVPVHENYIFFPHAHSNPQTDDHSFIGGREDIAKLLFFPPEYKWIWIWRYLFSRDFLRGKSFVESLYFGDDICFMLEVLHDADRFAIVSAPICLHRVSVNSITNSEFSKKHFNWFNIALKHIHDNLAGKYSDKFWRIFYPMFLKYMLHDGLLKTIKNPEYRKCAANMIKQVYGTPALPKKYLSIYQRIMLWLFIHGFADY